MKTIEIQRGERHRIIRRFSSSIPKSFYFDVEPLNGSGEVSGTVEVAGSRWLFSKPPVMLDLVPTMAVEKGFWDTLYSVFVTPDQDVRVVLR